MSDYGKQVTEIEISLQLIWDSMVSDPSKALSDSRKYELKCNKINYLQGVKTARFYQGWCLIYLSKLKEAIEILTELSSSFPEDDISENHINILNALGVAYNDLGDRTNAFYYYSIGLKMSRTAGLLNRELTIRSNMGTFYLENKNYTKALNHFLDILDKMDDTSDFLELKSVVLIDIGQCYHNLDRNEEAERYLLESRILCQKMNNLVNDADCLSELCKIKYAQNEFEVAKKYTMEALKICSEIENVRLECDLYLMMGDLENDYKYYISTNNLSKKIKHKPAYKTSCLKLAEYYEQTHDYKNALYYMREHNKTEREINNIAVEKKFHNLELEYEIERNKKNAELFKIKNMELKESLNWMTILNKIARATMSSLELNSIFNTVYSNINLLMDAEIFHVVFYDRDKDLLNIVKVIENGNEIEPFSYNAGEKSSFAGWAIKNRKEIVINNLDEEFSNFITKRAFYGEGPNAKSHLTVPIFMRNDEMGALAILSYRESAYKEEHVQLLKSLAAYLSIAIDNSRNYKKVKELNNLILREKEELQTANQRITELATHDNLTGLANRRVFYEMLEAAMEQAKRRSETLAVLFIDLDNFKPINDTWGHDAGDKVLIEIALRLRSSIRATDSIARIGGDEFLLLLNPVKNRSEARNVAEKIIHIVGEPIEIKNVKTKVGMSIGISIFPEEDTTADQLIINADSAMYKIKKGNKNGIGFYKKD